MYVRIRVCMCMYMRMCMYECICMNLHVCVRMYVPFEVKMPTCMEELKVHTSMQQLGSHEWLIKRPIVPVECDRVWCGVVRCDVM